MPGNCGENLNTFRYHEIASFRLIVTIKDPVQPELFPFFLVNIVVRFFQRSPGFKPVGDLFFVTKFTGKIKLIILQGIRQVLLVDDMTGEIMGILVAIAVTVIFHQFGDGITQMQRYRFVFAAFDLMLNARISRIERIALRRNCQIDRGFRQGQVAFRHANEMHCLLRGHRHHQRLRVGHTDVLRSGADKTTGDEQRVFSCFQHTRRLLKTAAAAA